MASRRVDGYRQERLGTIPNDATYVPTHQQSTTRQQDARIHQPISSHDMYTHEFQEIYNAPTHRESPIASSADYDIQDTNHSSTDEYPSQYPPQPHPPTYPHPTTTTPHRQITSFETPTLRNTPTPFRPTRPQSQYFDKPQRNIGRELVIPKTPYESRRGNTSAVKRGRGGIIGTPLTSNRLFVDGLHSYGGTR
jgi:hypothetical protein